MEWKRTVYDRRIRLILTVTLLLWIFFLGRFYYLQILSHEELAAAASMQQQISIQGLDSRGMILDRNLQPLTGLEKQYLYFLARDRIDADAYKLLAAVSAEEITVSDRNYSGYRVWRTSIYDETVSRRMKDEYNSYMLRLQSRYSSTQPACHLIGYLNEADQTGASGLEKAFEAQLKRQEIRLALEADGAGRLLAASAPVLYRENHLNQQALVTSLDLNLQKFCEKAAASADLTGAVLVSCAETGEILAWVSSPVFKPNELEQYIGKDGEQLVNKCIQGNYPPGSVFKIVLAAAALEQGNAEALEIYRCTGETEVEGVILGCKSGPAGGHGNLNMEQAMAVSCNCYFAHLGEKLGRETVLDMAADLGFGKTVMEIFSEESHGNLPEAAETSKEDTSNLSIGQGVLLATPVQVHQMMSAVAGEGMLTPLTVVSQTEPTPAKSVLPADTAHQLTSMLKKVMENGTGADGDWTGDVYGKTGTAETVRDGQAVKDCWFSGFCRAAENTYVITVLAENGESGAASCLPVFREITEHLALGQRKMK